jgi:hypothetical protein
MKNATSMTQTRLLLLARGESMLLKTKNVIHMKTSIMTRPHGDNTTESATTQPL